VRGAALPLSPGAAGVRVFATRARHHRGRRAAREPCGIRPGAHRLFLRAAAGARTRGEVVRDTNGEAYAARAQRNARRGGHGVHCGSRCRSQRRSVGVCASWRSLSSRPAARRDSPASCAAHRVECARVVARRNPCTDSAAECTVLVCLPGGVGPGPCACALKLDRVHRVAPSITRRERASPLFGRTTSHIVRIACNRARDARGSLHLCLLR
jgi:hypothetical protein